MTPAVEQVLAGALCAVVLVGCGDSANNQEPGAFGGSGQGGAIAVAQGGATNSATGGATSAGGSTSTPGGSSSGGSASGAGSGGATALGGASAVGGVAGNASTGGASSGGASATGGVASGGKASGGASAGGGTASGGSAAGGSTSATGGSGAAGTKPFKGVANSPCAARTALKTSWYYNWEQNEKEPCTGGAGGEFVPMIWGHAGAEKTSAGITTAITTFVSRGHKNVLSFNEPDNCPVPPATTGGQSCIPAATALSLLPAFDNPAIRIGSPATAANANPGQAWFNSFMSQLNANASVRVDFLAIHWYGWNAGSCDAKATQLENYIRFAEGFAGNRPIWITEFGCLNQSNPDAATVQAFYTGALAMFEKHPRIERYAWYPWIKNNELNNTDGSLTALGTAFAAAPAFK